MRQIAVGLSPGLAEVPQIAFGSPARLAAALHRACGLAAGLAEVLPRAPGSRAGAAEVLPTALGLRAGVAEVPHTQQVGRVVVPRIEAGDELLSTPSERTDADEEDAEQEKLSLLVCDHWLD